MVVLAKDNSATIIMFMIECRNKIDIIILFFFAKGSLRPKIFYMEVFKLMVKQNNEINIVIEKG